MANNFSKNRYSKKTNDVSCILPEASIINHQKYVGNYLNLQQLNIVKMLQDSNISRSID